MAIRKRTGKRGVTWQIDYMAPDGNGGIKRVRRSFKKKKDAEGELAKRVSLVAEGRYLDVKKDLKFTLGQLVEKYTENFQHQPSFQSLKHYVLRRFLQSFGQGTLLSNIRYVDLETYRNKLKQTTTIQGHIRQDSSVNREMICIQQLFRKAVEWEMLEVSPFSKGKSLRFKENNARTRYLDNDEIERLLGACKREYLKDIIITALHTGMRYKEVVFLGWEQIKDGLIYLTETKTDEARQIPVDKDLENLFKTIRKRNQLRSEYVFCNSQGRPFKYVTTAYTASLKRANIRGATFHTLRHSFASHYLMRGGYLATLQKYLGHRDIKMTMRYAHLSKEFARDEIERMNGLTGQICDTFGTSRVENESISSIVSTGQVAGNV